MSVQSVSDSSSVYSSYTSKYSEKKTQGQQTSKQSSDGVVYESSDITKMSEKDRANLVSQLKEEQANRQSQFVSLVKDMITKQGSTYGQTNDIWKFLADGNFTVDAQTKKDAQAAISEDGYWGVKQTSQRIFDFAVALSGGDEEKMKDMQKAFEKGFSQATKSWGKKLPGISSDTYDAVSKKFEDYYSKQNEDK